MTLKEIIRIAPESRKLLERYGLDPHTNHEFESACSTFGIDPLILKQELIGLCQNGKRRILFNQVVNKILEQHQILKENITSIRLCLKLCDANKDYTNELHLIQEYFLKLVEILEIHLYKDEVILFPEFKLLWVQQNNGHEKKHAPPFSMMYPIESLADEHESVIHILNRINQLIKQHMVSRNGRTPYANLGKAFKIFEQTLEGLIRLENTQLFPEVLAIEKQVNYKTDQ